MKTIVFLHGLGIGKEIWKQVVPFVDPSYRLIFLDLPGYGDNRDCDIGTNFDSMVAFITSKIKEYEDIDCLVSYSQSGVYAYEIAKQKKLPLKKIIIIAAPFFANNEWRKFNLLFRFISLNRAITSIVNFLITHPPIKQLIFLIGGLASVAYPQAMNDCVRFFQEAPNTPYTFRCTASIFRNFEKSKLQIPIECIYGERDRFAPPQSAPKKPYVIKDVYHLIPLEKPKDLATLISKVCK